MTALPRLLFVVTEDWFFRSHFLPLARRAVEEGYEVVVAARDTGALAGVDGVRLVDMPFARGSLKPWDIGRYLAHLNAVVARERPVIVHAIATKPAALVLLAHLRGAGRVFAVTGRGYLAVSEAPAARFVSWRFRRALRRGLNAERTILLVENEADRRWIEGRRPLPDTCVVVMPGAGVDPETLPVAPEPLAPIVVGVVARLVRSKGIDLVVEAVKALRANGSEISLRIAGSVDADNPEHVEEAELARWRATPGVELVGRINDIAAFWAGAHIACLPSRGGEGLPRVLLEAATCGRPVITTDVPGCADFVRHGETGLVAPANNAAALAEAIAILASNDALRRRMGEAGRARVINGYTDRHAANAAVRAWERALGQSAPLRTRHGEREGTQRMDAATDP